MRVVTRLGNETVRRLRPMITNPPPKKKTPTSHVILETRRNIRKKKKEMKKKWTGEDRISGSKQKDPILITIAQT